MYRYNAGWLRGLHARAGIVFTVFIYTIYTDAIFTFNFVAFDICSGSIGPGAISANHANVTGSLCTVNSIGAPDTNLASTNVASAYRAGRTIGSIHHGGDSREQRSGHFTVHPDGQRGHLWF